MAKKIQIKSWSRKKRLQIALSYLPKNRTWVYDLFCDHGDLGKACLNEGKNVVFNDKREHLIEAISQVLKAKSLSRERFELEIKNAQDLQLKEESFVYMLGVGGHLISECLVRWAPRLSGQRFLAMPTYYPLELYETLKSISSTRLEMDFVFEAGRGYEVFLFSFDAPLDYEFPPLFDEETWKERGPAGLVYLRKRYNSLRKSVLRSENEEKLFHHLRQFIEGS